MIERMCSYTDEEGISERASKQADRQAGSRQASKQASEEDREKLAMTADVIGSEAIRRDDGCLTGARSLARQL